MFYFKRKWLTPFDRYSKYYSNFSYITIPLRLFYTYNRCSKSIYFQEKDFLFHRGRIFWNTPSSIWWFIVKSFNILKSSKSIKDASVKGKPSAWASSARWYIVGPTERWTNARWPCEKIYYRKSSPRRFLVRNGKIAQGRVQRALWEPNKRLELQTKSPLADLTRGPRKWIVISQKRANRSYNSESVMKVVPHDVNSQLPLLNVKIVRGTFKYIITSYNFLLSILPDCESLNLFETNRYVTSFLLLLHRGEIISPTDERNLFLIRLIHLFFFIFK